MYFLLTFTEKETDAIQNDKMSISTTQKLKFYVYKQNLYKKQPKYPLDSQNMYSQEKPQQPPLQYNKKHPQGNLLPHQSKHQDIDKENNQNIANIPPYSFQHSHHSVEYLTSRIKDLEQQKLRYQETIKQLRQQNQQLMGVVVQASHHDVNRAKKFVRKIEELIQYRSDTFRISGDVPSSRLKTEYSSSYRMSSRRSNSREISPRRTSSRACRKQTQRINFQKQAIPYQKQNSIQRQQKKKNQGCKKKENALR